MQCNIVFIWHLGRLDFFNVTRQNVFYKINLRATYVLIKVTIDLLYHSALILDEIFVYDKYFSK